MHGIHHVTAISGDPAATVRFYGDTLGLRLVKQTVNFDDPGVEALPSLEGVVEVAHD